MPSSSTLASTDPLPLLARLFLSSSRHSAKWLPRRVQTKLIYCWRRLSTGEAEEKWFSANTLEFWSDGRVLQSFTTISLPMPSQDFFLVHLYRLWNENSWGQTVAPNFKISRFELALNILFYVLCQQVLKMIITMGHLVSFSQCAQFNLIWQRPNIILNFYLLCTCLIDQHNTFQLNVHNYMNWVDYYCFCYCDKYITSVSSFLF